MKERQLKAATAKLHRQNAAARKRILPEEEEQLPLPGLGEMPGREAIPANNSTQTQKES